ERQRGGAAGRHRTRGGGARPLDRRRATRGDLPAMCLIALAIDQHPRFPLVIAANRDEFYARPAAALDWWTPPSGRAPILAGRDLEAGGTWLGLARSGRVAMLTNVREPDRRDPGARSRGEIVPAWLDADV